MVCYFNLNNWYAVRQAQSYQREMLFVYVIRRLCAPKHTVALSQPLKVPYLSATRLHKKHWPVLSQEFRIPRKEQSVKFSICEALHAAITRNCGQAREATRHQDSVSRGNDSFFMLVSPVGKTFVNPCKLYEDSTLYWILPGISVFCVCTVTSVWNNVFYILFHAGILSSSIFMSASSFVPFTFSLMDSIHNYMLPTLIVLTVALDLQDRLWQMYTCSHYSFFAPMFLTSGSFNVNFSSLYIYIYIITKVF